MRPHAVHWVAAAALCVAGGCAVTVRTLPVEPPARAVVLGEAEIEFDPSLGGVAVPVVRARLGETRARLVIDTARPTALQSTFGRGGERTVAITVGGWARKITATTSADEPLDGKLNPLDLVPRGFAVVDLRAGRLLLVDGTAAAMGAWLRERFGGVVFTPLGRSGDDPRILLVPAALEKRPPLPVLLDASGEWRTAFSVAYAGEPTSAETASAVTANGITATEVSGRTVRLAGRDLGPVTLVALSEWKAPAVAPTAEAVVGLDVLRGLVLVLPADPKAPILVGGP